MLLSGLRTWRRFIRSRITRGVSRRRSRLNTTHNTALYNTETLEDRILLAATPTLSINDVQQVEGDNGTSLFVFTVSRSGKTNQPSSVGYYTSSSATPGVDFEPVNDIF